MKLRQSLFDKKEKYLNPKRELFVAQNFSKNDIDILEKIIKGI